MRIEDEVKLRLFNNKLMAVPSKKVQQLPSEQEQYLQAPSTPKKKAKYFPSEQSTARRVKSYTTMKEGQTVNMIYILLVFIWVIAVSFLLFMAFQTKLKAAESEANQEVSQCRLDFDNNRCINPVKGLVKFCSQKMSCLSQVPFVRMEKQVSYMRMLGEILSEFCQGAGVVGLLVGLVLMAACVRQGGKTKETVTLQFFDDK